MKKFVTLMLMLCMATACAVMFSACENANGDGEVNNKDGDTPVVYTVTEAQWNKAIDIKVCFALDVTAGAENKSFVFYGNNIMYTTKENNEEVLRYYEKNDENYFSYYKENGEWKREIISNANFEKYAEQFSFLKDKFGSFTFNENDKSYFCESVGEDYKNVKVYFENGKIVKVNADNNSESVSIKFSYGVQPFSLPSATYYTVTKEEWNKALELEGDLEAEVNTNSEWMSAIFYGNYTMVTTKENNKEVVYYYEQDGENYFCYYQENGEWEKVNYTYGEIRDYYFKGTTSSLKDTFDKFTFDETDNSYLCESFDKYINNVRVYFINGKVVKINAENNSVSGSFLFSYDVQPFSLPKLTCYTVTEEQWKKIFGLEGDFVATEEEWVGTEKNRSIEVVAYNNLMKTTRGSGNTEVTIYYEIEENKETQYRYDKVGKKWDWIVYNVPFSVLEISKLVHNYYNMYSDFAYDKNTKSYKLSYTESGSDYYNNYSEVINVYFKEGVLLKIEKVLTYPSSSKETVKTLTTFSFESQPIELPVLNETSGENTVTEEQWNNALALEDDFVIEMEGWGSYSKRYESSSSLNVIKYNNLFKIWSSYYGETNYYENDGEKWWEYRYNGGWRCQETNGFTGVEWFKEFKFSDFTYNENTKSYDMVIDINKRMMCCRLYFENAKLTAFESYEALFHPNLNFIYFGEDYYYEIGDKDIMEFTYESQPFELPDLGNVIAETEWDNAVDVQGNFKIIKDNSILASFYNNIVKVGGLYYEKDGENYYRYYQENGKWNKASIEQAEFDALRKEYDFASALKGKFSEFEAIGSSHDKKYTCAVLTINGQEFSDVEVIFVGGKLFSFNGTLNKGTENEVEYELSTYYVTEITLPEVEEA